MSVVRDLCGQLPESPPAHEWGNRAKVIGGMCAFVVYVAVYVAVSLGLGGKKMRKQTEQAGQRME